MSQMERNVIYTYFLTVFFYDSVFTQGVGFKLENIFQNCHIKIIFLGSSIQFHDDYYLLFRQCYTIEATVFSIQQIDFPLNNTTSTSSQLQIYHRNVKYHSTCFMHVYVENTTDRYLQKVLDDMRQIGEWPHHFIFIKSFQSPFETGNIQENVKFYRTQLPKSFARGLILEVTLQSHTIKSINLVCIRCGRTLHPLNETGDNSVTALLNFQLDQETRATYMKMLVSYLQAISNGCDVANASAHPSSLHRHSPTCAFKALQKMFNFTFYSFQTFDKTTDFAYFYASPGIFFGWENYNELSETRSIEWISFNIRRLEYQFINFEYAKRLNLLIFFKPYDEISWLLFYSTMTAMLILWLFILRRNFMDTCKFYLELHSVFLDQAVKTKRMFNGASSEYWHNLLRNCWLIWVSAMLIFSGGYKGKMFSFLATSTSVSGPQSLLELIDDSSYTLLSSETVYVLGGEGEAYPVPMLEYFFKVDGAMNGTPGKGFPFEYVLLRKAKVHADLNSASAIAQGIIEYAVNTSRKRKRREFRVANVVTTKFSWLHRIPEELSTLVVNFIPNVVASKPVVIRGFERITPWAVSKNFLYDSFMSSIAWLEQAGFFLVFERYRKTWAICNSVKSVKEHLRRFDKSALKEVTSQRRCLNKMFSGKFFFDDATVGVQLSLSMEQCTGMFQILLFGLCVTSISMMIEIMFAKNIANRLGTHAYSLWSLLSFEVHRIL